MPVWPFLMLIVAALTLWGWRVGSPAVPALALLGYVGMRGVVWGLPDHAHEIAGCAWWLAICVFMAWKGGHVPAFFYALSALTYPVMLVFGFRMVYMGLSPVVAEVFAALALLSIGGGLWNADRMADPGRHRPGPVLWLARHSVPLAAREAGSSGDHSQGAGR